MTTRLVIGSLVLGLMAFLLIGCGRGMTLPKTSEFEPLTREAWGTWRIYKVRHNPTGTCFVVIDPQGDGGGTMATAPAAVCGDIKTEPIEQAAQ